MKTQQTYRTDIEFIDKDHIASMFMANCEMNNVYSEGEYYLFVAEIIGKDDSYFKDELIKASLDTQKEIQRQLAEVDVWYEQQFRTDYEGNKVIIDDWNREDESAKVALNKERNKRIQAIHDNRDSILQNYIKIYKQNTIINDWKNIGYKKVFDSTLKYQSIWTYDDVLNYFKKNGFPIKRQTEIEKLESGLNVCKIRHILRNDVMIDEAMLLALIEMQERKSFFEYVADRDKLINIIMSVVSIIVAVACAFIPGGQVVTGWLLAAQIIGTVAGVAGAVLGLVNIALADQNEAEMKDVTQKTNDLMLRNMPKSGNFVDTSITDPYSMYANGRLWKQGAAGRDRYDQILPHEPYRALDDKFKDSDMFDVLNNKIDKEAGGDQYLSNLYSDGKWVNPSSLKALLNGAVPIYLSMRNKITQACFKWLSKEGLGTYYLFEDNPDDSWTSSKDNYIDRYRNIEFENEGDVKGFTFIATTYLVKEKREIMPGYIVESGRIVGYIHDVSTKWDKDEGNKTQIKTDAITDNIHVFFIRNESKTLLGKDIDIFNLQDFKTSIIGGIMPPISTPIDSVCRNLTRYLDEKKKYECEYEVWNCGGKEIKYYTKIQEVGRNKIDISETSPKFSLKYEWKFWIRGEAKAKIRFRAREKELSYTTNLFIKEELNTPCVPYIEGKNVYRYFDRNTRFASIPGFSFIFMGSYNALADTPSKDFTEVTIYHKHKKDNKRKYKTFNGKKICEGSTYFGVSPFLNAQRNITMF